MQTAVSAWGPDLYPEFLRAAFLPNIESEWLNHNSCSAPNNAHAGPQCSSLAGNTKGSHHPPSSLASTLPIQLDPRPQPTQRLDSSTLYPQRFFFNTPSPMSFLASPQEGQDSTASLSQGVSPSLDLIDVRIVRSPSPNDSSSVSIIPPRSRHSEEKHHASSLDFDHEHSYEEHEGEISQPIEREGMSWGMKVDDYRALSARERKRVRNRFSARVFRAKRKGERNAPEGLSRFSLTLWLVVFVVAWQYSPRLGNLR